MAETHDTPRREQERFTTNQRRIYEIALHDVRRAIDTMAADNYLISYIYKRLARAVAEAYDLPESGL